jgi:membrane fusion protein (multidrug efflux system)
MENTTMPEPDKRSKKPALKIILLLVVSGIAYWAVSKFTYARHHEETDDAQLDAEISPVMARVGGFVRAIRFEENSPVRQGDTLVLIDDRDYMIKLQQAEAAVAAAIAAEGVARSGVETAQANLRTAQSTVESAKVRVWRADKEFARIGNLQKEGAGTAQQFDAAKAEKDAADAQLATANRQTDVAAASVNAATEQVKVAATNVAVRQADVDFAKLQWSYTSVTAPASGIASKKNMQVGQLVNQGSPLFAVVSDTNVYIVANFKETQIGKMKIGQSVEVKVDAYPDRVFSGKIYSFSPATGAKFSLLPPDNATGNYVKVVQRVPVKIVLEDANAEAILRPGMSVHVSVQID